MNQHTPKNQQLRVECKPERLWSTPKVSARCAALEALVQQRGYKFQLIDPSICETEVMQDLTEKGDIVWHKNYVERVNNWNKGVVNL